MQKIIENNRQRKQNKPKQRTEQVHGTAIFVLICTIHFGPKASIPQTCVVIRKQNNLANALYRQLNQ